MVRGEAVGGFLGVDHRLTTLAEDIWVVVAQDYVDLGAKSGEFNNLKRTQVITAKG